MKSKLGKYLLIYFGCVAGLATVIGGSFMLGELANRLKVEKQILIEVPAETEATEGFLTLSVWTPVSNAPFNENHEYNFKLTDLELGESVRICGYTDKPFESPEKDEDGQFVLPGLTRAGNEAGIKIIAYADAEIAMDYTFSNTFGYAGEDRGFGLLYGGAILPTYKVEEFTRRDELMMWMGIASGNRSSEEIDTQRLKHRLSTGMEGEPLHYRYYTERLGDLHPFISGEDALVTRDVCESALMIYALDDADPNKILAEAEVRITYRSPWKFPQPDGRTVGPIRNNEEKIMYALKLYNLGINNPDDYGYTEAVLYSYWQSDAVS